MGLWGTEGFGSDDALDWLQELDPAAGREPVLRTLRRAAESTDAHLDARRAQVALAAAELIAALYGRPDPSLPEVARKWLAAQGTLSASEPADLDALVLATRALDFVVTSSELTEIWSQRADQHLWHATLDDLRMRLAAAAGSLPDPASTDRDAARS